MNTQNEDLLKDVGTAGPSIYNYKSDEKKEYLISLFKCIYDDLKINEIKETESYKKFHEPFTI